MLSDRKLIMKPLEDVTGKVDNRRFFHNPSFKTNAHSIGILSTQCVLFYLNLRININYFRKFRGRLCSEDAMCCLIIRNNL